MHAGFQAQRPQTRSQRFRNQLLDDRNGNPLPARTLAHIHPFHFGKVGEERDTAAAHGLAVRSRKKKPDVRLKDRIQPKPMPLLGRIVLRKLLIELLDQRADFRSYGGNVFNLDARRDWRLPSISAHRPPPFGKGRCRKKTLRLTRRL